MILSRSLYFKISSLTIPLLVRLSTDHPPAPRIVFDSLNLLLQILKANALSHRFVKRVPEWLLARHA